MEGKKVFVTRRVPIAGVDLLKKSGCVVSQWDNDDVITQSALIEGVKGCDALFCLLTDRIDKEVLDAAGPQLKVVATMSVGYEHIDIAECRARKIKVSFTPEVSTDAVAELTVALLLAASRNLLPAVNAVKSGEWSTWGPLWMCGHGLAGSTVGIFGFGRIGKTVGSYLRPFGVQSILYNDVAPRPSDAAEIGAEFVPFDSLLAQSDFVIVMCPLTKETEKMFNRQTFSKMKRSAVFVNTGRGGVVDQDDLYEALTNGTIAAAGLDVTTPEPLPVDHRLLQLKNCVILPHIGSATLSARTKMSELAARNILAALSDSPMPSEVA